MMVSIKEAMIEVLQNYCACETGNVHLIAYTFLVKICFYTKVVLMVGGCLRIYLIKEDMSPICGFNALCPCISNFIISVFLELVIIFISVILLKNGDY